MILLTLIKLSITAEVEDLYKHNQIYFPLTFFIEIIDECRRLSF